MNKIKTLLIGSGEFAIPLFKTAMQLDFLDITGIVTQPDKPFGRKQKMQGSPVFEVLKDEPLVKTSNIKFFKPVKFRNEYQPILEETNPELVLVASYGQILPSEFIEYPKYKALNFHGSILPQLRGAVPVQMAILQGLKETGVTLQVMSQGMDEGDIISTRSTAILEGDTTETLMNNLSTLGVEILQTDLSKYLELDIKPKPQGNINVTYCYKADIEKEKAEIKFETDINLAERMIRAFYPWPIAYVVYQGRMLKIFKSQIHSNQSSSKTLQIRREGKNLLLDLQNGTLELLELQLEGKKRDVSNNYLFLVD